MKMFKHIMGFVQLNKGFAFALFATIICCIVAITYLFMNYPAWIVLALFGGVLVVIGTIVLIALLATKRIKLPKLSEFKKPSWLKFPTFNFKRKASVTPEVKSFKRRPKFLRRLSLLRKKWELWNFRTWVTSLWKRNPKPEVIPVVKSKKRGVRLKLRFAILRRNWKRFNLRAWVQSVFKWNAKPKAVPVLESKKRIPKWKLRLRLLRMKWRRFKMPKFPKLNLLARLNNARKSIAIAYHLKRIRTREGLLNPEKKYRRKRAARPSLFKQLWAKSGIRKFVMGIGSYFKQAWQNFSIKNMFAKIGRFFIRVFEETFSIIGGLALAIAVGFVVRGLYSYSKVLGIIVGLVVLGIAIWQLIKYVKEKRAAKNLLLQQPDPQPVVIQETGKWEAFKQKTSTFFSNIKMPTWRPSMPSVELPNWKMVLGIVASMIIIGGIIFGSAFVGSGSKFKKQEAVKVDSVLLKTSRNDFYAALNGGTKIETDYFWSNGKNSVKIAPGETVSIGIKFGGNRQVNTTGNVKVCNLIGKSCVKEITAVSGETSITLSPHQIPFNATNTDTTEITITCNL